jgi:hypothetical protein
MTEPEHFLQRWSRRKHEASGEAEPTEKPVDAMDAPPADAEPAQADELFDIADLPPVDSIGADTDVSAFLKRSVPPDLTRAALRRAWSEDPAIRDFVGLSENSWNFNDPTAMGGFGAIEPAEVARLITQAMGVIAETEPQAGAAASEKAEKHPDTPASKSSAAAQSEEPSSPQRNIIDAATQKESDA